MSSGPQVLRSVYKKNVNCRLFWSQVARDNMIFGWRSILFLPPSGASGYRHTIGWSRPLLPACKARMNNLLKGVFGTYGQIF